MGSGGWVGVWNVEFTKEEVEALLNGKLKGKKFDLGFFMGGGCRSV